MLSNWLVLICNRIFVFDHAITNSGIDNKVINFRNWGQNAIEVEDKAGISQEINSNDEFLADSKLIAKTKREKNVSCLKQWISITCIFYTNNIIRDIYFSCQRKLLFTSGVNKRIKNSV